jgi:hypothetical protein
MTPDQLSGPLTQFQANTLSYEGMGKILATLNRGLGDRQIDAQQLDETLGMWWPRLQKSLDSLPPASEEVALRSSESKLDEVLSIARENLRRENLRLQSSSERDEKLNSLLGFMEKMAALTSPQQASDAAMFFKELRELSDRDKERDAAILLPPAGSHEPSSDPNPAS